MGRLRGRQPRRDGGVPELGDDPVPLRLDQPDARLRLPCLESLADDAHPRQRRRDDGCVDLVGRLRRKPALGRALRGPADGRDVPRDGVARATTRGGRQRGGGARRAARALPARRVARAADARDDRAWTSRAARTPRPRVAGACGRTGRARANRPHHHALAAAREGGPAELPRRLGDRRRDVRRGCLRPLGRGGAASLAARSRHARAA